MINVIFDFFQACAYAAYANYITQHIFNIASYNISITCEERNWQEQKLRELLTCKN